MSHFWRPSVRVLLGILLAAATLPVPIAVTAQERPWSEKPIFGEDEDGEPWKELGFELPGFPTDESLALLDLEYTDHRYDFFLDRNSLSVGKDRVLRYTVVVQSTSGRRNVFYEGVRCSTLEYKTYAYGTRRGKFKPYSKPKWKLWNKVPRQGPHGFRASLSEDVLCDRTKYTQNVKDVLRRVDSSTSRSYQAAFPSANDEGVLRR